MVGQRSTSRLVRESGYEAVRESAREGERTRSVWRGQEGRGRRRTVTGYGESVRSARARARGRERRAVCGAGRRAGVGGGPAVYGWAQGVVRRIV